RAAAPPAREAPAHWDPTGGGDARTAGRPSPDPTCGLAPPPPASLRESSEQPEERIQNRDGMRGAPGHVEIDGHDTVRSVVDFGMIDERSPGDHPEVHNGADSVV